VVQEWLFALAAALGEAAAALVGANPAAAAVWAAAARTLDEMSRDPGFGERDRDALLHDAALEPMAPAWLLVEGLIALVVDHLAAGADASAVAATNRSLDGLRSLGDAIRGARLEAR
jgi:hypothetical protein